MTKVNYTNKKIASGWHKDKPHTKKERSIAIKKNGSKCFLRPSEKKYPICDKKGNYDCRGIIAAKFWADTAETKARKRPDKKRPYSFKKISNNAKKIGKSIGCIVFKKTKKNYRGKNQP